MVSANPQADVETRRYAIRSLASNAVQPIDRKSCSLTHYCIELAHSRRQGDGNLPHQSMRC